MNLEQKIKKIQKRNAKVELDKSWETSCERIFIVAVLTYIVMIIFFYFAELPKPFANSIVPALAFILSTLTLPIFKRWWIKRKQNENSK